MKSKYFRMLILGLAMLILGPVTGWGLTLIGLFHTATNVPIVAPGAIPDIGVQMQKTTGEMLLSLLPIIIGLFIGTLGLFLVILSLLLNFVK
jgi:hypothetical protein